MSPEQIASHQARNRHEEMTPDQVAADRWRHQRGNMSPVNVRWEQARDGHHNESFLPVEQQWDLAHPCSKYVCVCFFLLFDDYFFIDCVF